MQNSQNLIYGNFRFFFLNFSSGYLIEEQPFLLSLKKKNKKQQSSRKLIFAIIKEKTKKPYENFCFQKLMSLRYYLIMRTTANSENWSQYFGI